MYTNIIDCAYVHKLSLHKFRSILELNILNNNIIMDIRINKNNRIIQYFLNNNDNNSEQTR